MFPTRLRCRRSTGLAGVGPPGGPIHRNQRVGCLRTDRRDGLRRPQRIGGDADLRQRRPTPIPVSMTPGWPRTTSTPDRTPRPCGLSSRADPGPPGLGVRALTGRFASAQARAIGCARFTRGVAQLGSASFGTEGRGFESRHPDCVDPIWKARSRAGFGSSSDRRSVSQRSTG